MTLTAFTLLAIYDGADYERRDDAVYRVAHDGGMETRWCHIAEWREAKMRLEVAAQQRRIKIVTTRPAEEQAPLPKAPKPHKNNGRKMRHKATPEIIARLANAPTWCCASCGCHDGRQRSAKNSQYCMACAKGRPIGGA